MLFSETQDIPKQGERNDIYVSPLGGEHIQASGVFACLLVCGICMSSQLARALSKTL